MPLTNLREVGGDGFQASRRPGRRTLYRSNTDPVSVDVYPVSVAVVIDLRRFDEIKMLPHPLAGIDGYRAVPFFDPRSDVEAKSSARSLEEQYDHWMTRHARTIAAVLRAVSESDADVLICCSAGKDRTGMISALLARLWGADLDRIGSDYAASGPGHADRFARELAESADLEQTRRQQRCVPETGAHVIATLEEEFGSVSAYLRWLGLGEDEIRLL